MPSFVLDTSVAISWCFSDEASTETDALLQQLSHPDVVVAVPALFFFELQNVLRRGEKQNRITTAELHTFWRELLLVEFEVAQLDVMTVEPRLIEISPVQLVRV